MAKKTSTVKCESLQITEKTAALRLSIGATDAAPAAGTTEPQRQAKTVITVAAADPKEVAFWKTLEPGKEYKLTIE